MGATDNLYGGADGPSSAEPVRPPRGFVVGAAISVVVATALFPLELLSTHVAGYVLASFVTITMVGLYRSISQRRRRSPYYTPQPKLRRIATGLLVVGTLVAAAHVWVIATHLAS